MFSTSYIEISRSAYKNNLKYLQSLLGKNVKFSSVIKGNAYGHGIENMVAIAESAGVNHFSVFSADEALRAFKVKKAKTDIMIMGMIDDPELEWAIVNGIEFYVFDLARVETALKIARKHKKRARIHVEVETGFNRTGFNKKALPALLKLLTTNEPNHILEGLCTHYAGAESVNNYVRVKKQIIDFKNTYNFFVKQDVMPKLRHTACSAAALTYPQTIMEMVRIGIAQYGFWPSQETYMHQFIANKNIGNPLKRLISWKSKVMNLKEVEAGEFVGYGTSYMANKKIKMAVIPVGYAHGFSRSLSNMGRVLIRGKRAPVIGTVTMNTIAVNVTDIPGIEKGDEVVLVGKQKKLTLDVASFSELSNLLNYELLTRLPADIPRTIIK